MSVIQPLMINVKMYYNSKKIVCWSNFVSFSSWLIVVTSRMHGTLRRENTCLASFGICSIQVGPFFSLAVTVTVTHRGDGPLLKSPFLDIPHCNPVLLKARIASQGMALPLERLVSFRLHLATRRTRNASLWAIRKDCRGAPHRFANCFSKCHTNSDDNGRGTISCAGRREWHPCWRGWLLGPLLFTLSG